MKKLIVLLLFTFVGFGFAGIKISYIGLGEEETPFYYTISADSGKMSLSFESSNAQDGGLHFMYIDGKLYMVNRAQKTYMDFGTLPKDEQQDKEFDDVDWTKLKKTGKKLKIASFPCKEYKYTDGDLTYKVYVTKNKKLINALKDVANGFVKASVGPMIYQSGSKGGVLLGIKQNGKMVFQAKDIKLGKIPAKTFSLKGYKKFDMNKLMEQMKLQMQGLESE